MKENDLYLFYSYIESIQLSDHIEWPNFAEFSIFHIMNQDRTRFFPFSYVIYDLILNKLIFQSVCLSNFLLPYSCLLSLLVQMSVCLSIMVPC